MSARVSYFGLIIALVLGCGAPEIEIECVAPPAPTPVKTESTENTEAAKKIPMELRDECEEQQIELAMLLSKSIIIC